METKICTKCSLDKPLQLYSKRKAVKSGYRSQCKDCDLIDKTAYYRTKKGVSDTIFNSQKKNSKKRGHALPTYTKEELRDWLYSNPAFHVLYDNWKRLDYQTDYKPSVDRKNDNIGYTMSNIQIMTWGENNAKGHRTNHKTRMRNGRFKRA